MARTSSALETDGYPHNSNCQEPQPIASKEFQFMDEWVGLTVKNEISCGASLRQKNSKRYIDHKILDVVNIDCNKTPCPDKTIVRRRTRRIAQIKTSPCSPRSFSPPFSRTLQGNTRYVTLSNTPSIRSRRRPRKCPMRIAELAVPSKRHCIETWRNNADVLPGFMINRLKQYVMDESPIVKVSDAVNCFIKRKLTRPCKKPRTNYFQAHKNMKCLMEIRGLSALFGHKIARKLITPLNITLNSELQRISDVVAGDIANIIKDKKITYCSNPMSCKIHREISEKVALWIATILEDTSLKMLEDDLRVKKCNKDLKKREQKIIKLIEKHLVSYHRGASDLEEEEGPALDFIDDLVENVLSKCSSSETNTDASLETFSKYVTKIDESEIQSENQLDHDEDALGRSTPEEFHSSVSDSLININSTNDTERLNDQSDFRSNPSQRTEPESDASNTNNIETTDLTKTHDDDNKTEESNTNEEVNEEELEADNKDIRNIISSIIDQFDIREVFVALSEESSQDKMKKVTFSQIDIASGKPIDYFKNSINHPFYTRSGNVSWQESFEQIKANFSLAPRNYYLLSDVDETWPESMMTPMLKVTESVSKSITSLGRILESEELISIPGQEHKPEQNTQKVILIEESIKIIEPDSNKMYNRKEKYLNPIEVFNETTEISENSGTDSEFFQDFYNSSDNFNDELPTSSKLLVEDIEHGSKPAICNLENYNIELNMRMFDKASHQKFGWTTDTIKKPDGISMFFEGFTSTDHTQKVYIMNNDEKGSNYKTDTIVTNEKRNVKEKSRDIREHNTTQGLITADIRKIYSIGRDVPYHEYKAILKQKEFNEHTSDVVVGIGRGDNNDDTCSENNVIFEAVQQKLQSSRESKFEYKVNLTTAPGWARGIPRDKIQLKEGDIRKWCQDLDQAFINLEQWNLWVDNTCRSIIFYKQRGEVNKVFAQNTRQSDARDWMKLKQKVDNDAFLWKKLNHRTREVLRDSSRGFKRKLKRSWTRADSITPTHIDLLNGKTIIGLLNEIDALSLWMHRMILSTGYCMKCDCQYYSRKPRMI